MYTCLCVYVCVVSAYLVSQQFCSQTQVSSKHYTDSEKQIGFLPPQTPSVVVYEQGWGKFMATH